MENSELLDKVEVGSCGSFHRVELLHTCCKAKCLEGVLQVSIIAAPGSSAGPCQYKWTATNLCVQGEGRLPALRRDHLAYTILVVPRLLGDTFNVLHWLCKLGIGGVVDGTML